MRTEVFVFSIMAVFFAIAATVYGITSGDPAGTAALAVSFLLSSLITFYLSAMTLRMDPRPEDRPDASPDEGAGPVEFFSPSSLWPVTTAFAVAVFALGIATGVWLTIVGACLLLPSVVGFVFQYVIRYSEQ